MRGLALTLITALNANACQATETPPPTAESSVIGIWVNERGSAVTFTDVEGTLGGYYQTNLGAPETAARFPLTGFIEGDQMTFTVNFKGYGSLTSWTGQISQDAQGRYLRTLWHLTRDVPDAEEDAELWQSITAGAATFRPAPENPLDENPPD